MGGVCPLCGANLSGSTIGHACAPVQVPQAYVAPRNVPQLVHCDTCGQPVAGIMDVKTGKLLKQPAAYKLYRRIRNAEKALKRVLLILEGEIQE